MNTATETAQDAQSIAQSSATVTPGPILPPKSAAGYLAISVPTLARLRLAGTGPVFIRLSPNRIGYRQSDLESYLASKRRTSTTQTS